MSKLLPESRKLRVLLISVAGFVLNSFGDWLTPDQIETILSLVMVWLGGQSLADAGLQGKILGEVRRQRKMEKVVSDEDLFIPSKNANDSTNSDPREPATAPTDEEGTNTEATVSDMESEDAAVEEPQAEPADSKPSVSTSYPRPRPRAPRT